MASASSPTLSSSSSSPSSSPRFALHPLRPSPMTRIRGGRLGSGGGTKGEVSSGQSANEGEASRDSADGGGGSFVSSVSRLSSRAVQLGGMDEDKLRRYKTVMCQRLSGPEGCKYGVHCDLSAEQQLKLSAIHRTTTAHPPTASVCAVCCLFSPLCACFCCTVLCLLSTASLCCVSAHTADELRRSLNGVAYAPVLCAVKGCSDPLCKFAHNMAESQYHPDVHKHGTLHTHCLCAGRSPCASPCLYSPTVSVCCCSLLAVACEPGIQDQAVLPLRQAQRLPSQSRETSTEQRRCTVGRRDHSTHCRVVYRCLPSFCVVRSAWQLLLVRSRQARAAPQEQEVRRPQLQGAQRPYNVTVAHHRAAQRRSIRTLQTASTRTDATAGQERRGAQGGTVRLGR